tara:strand:+ start:4600 stop:6000 length:1401 start_codon:yes stop_codon:yes gene_type:complete
MAKKITKSLIKKLIEQQLQKTLKEQSDDSARDFLNSILPGPENISSGARKAAAGAATGATKAIRKGETGGLPDGMPFFDIIKSIPQGDCEKVLSVLKQVIKPVIDNDPGEAWYSELIQIIDISNQNPGFKPEIMGDLARRLDGVLQKMGGFKIPGYTGGSIDTMSGTFEKMDEGRSLLKENPGLLIAAGVGFAIAAWGYYISRSDDPEKPTEQEVEQMPNSDLAKAIAAILLNPGGSRPLTVYDMIATIVAFITGCTELISWIPRVPKKKDDKPIRPEVGGGGGNCYRFNRAARKVTGLKTKPAVRDIQETLVNMGYSVAKIGASTPFGKPGAGTVRGSESRKYQIDGLCGRKTMDAVKRFQRDAQEAGLDLGKYGVDGIVGPFTYKAMRDYIEKGFLFPDMSGRSEFSGPLGGVVGPDGKPLNDPMAQAERERIAARTRSERGVTNESQAKQLREHFARWEKLWK